MEWLYRPMCSATAWWRTILVLAGRRRAVGAVWLARNLIDSPRGPRAAPLHGSEVAASALGIDAAAHKLNGVRDLGRFARRRRGARSAHYAGFITPAKASFLHSIELVTMVVFGGMASTFGAVVGAAVLTTLPQLLTVFKEYEMVLLGAALMLTMIFMPRGLVPTLERALAAARKTSVSASAGRRAGSGRRRARARRCGARHHRPERRRQDHAAQRALGHLQT